MRKNAIIAFRTTKQIKISTMKKIKLAKALKEKNKLIKKILGSQKLLNETNSIIKGNPRDFQPSELLSTLKSDTDKLVRLKCAINKANQPINQLIIRNAENKSLISYLKKLDTKDGKSVERYSRETPIEYEASIKGRQVLEEITKLEADIEKNQEEIDLFNHTTDVEVHLD